MAFYRGSQSPRDEPYAPNPLSPPQRNANRWSASMLGTSDVRGALQRRFTTNEIPTLSPMGQARRQAAGDVQQVSTTHNRMTPSERAALHYETLLQAQRKIQEELEKVDAATRHEVDNNLRHEQGVTQLFAQSEPTTPPEYHAGLPGNFSRPNRYSTASLTSPPGIVTRGSRSSTQLTSPPIGIARIYNNSTTSNLPSQSVPGSRRQSDGEEDEDDFNYNYDNSLRRAAANPNRNSMPITSYDRSKRNTTDLVFGPVNTAGFLFDEEDKQSKLNNKSEKTSPQDFKTYLQVQHTADGFPKLIRREENGDLSLSAASAALDLASASSDTSLQHGVHRTAPSRHRISLPPSALGGNMSIAPMNSILANANDPRSAANARRSVEVHFTADTKRPGLLSSAPRGFANGSQFPMSSYSTNDIPTLKSINGDVSEGGVSLASSSSSARSKMLSNTTSPEQHPGTTSRLSSASFRQSQDFSATSKSDELQDAFNKAQSSLHANATPFGPGSQEQNQGFGSPNMTPFGQPAAYYGGYGMQMMNNGFNNMNLGSPNGYTPQGQWQGQVNSPYQQNTFNNFQYQQNAQAGPGAGRFDNQRVNGQQRRQAAEEAQAKFNSINVDQLVGEIYSLCKDQHGCRFLQRKLEERNEDTVKVIFEEVKHHMIDLMVDPFGNYLCQKLLESVNDDQRTVLIQNAKPAMTKIALNQHGTRALQKMIEYITTPEQTTLIIEALGNDVVLLIQDLNGNHVIQKCLNHLSSADAAFIFDAVGAHCITVGTHRHGCCVLQRCIDHADGLQKGQMVDHVVRNAYALVQDPFGNYVVQYILDLSEPCFTEPLCRAFYGEIPNLSRQKFSSNVIEKCIRCSSNETRRQIITELLPQQTLEKLLRDGFANYVVQTAMDFADEDLKLHLLENVRAILPGIRNTPHGRRIQSKIAEHDNRATNASTAILSPLETATTSPLNPAFAVPLSSPAAPRANRHGMIGAPPQWGVSGGFNEGGFDGGNYSAGYGSNGIASPTPQRGIPNYGMFNSAPSYQNGYGAPGFANAGRQPYGHF